MTKIIPIIVEQPDPRVSIKLSPLSRVKSPITKATNKTPMIMPIILFDVYFPDPKGKNLTIGGVGLKLSFGLRPVERLERKE